MASNRLVSYNDTVPPDSANRQFGQKQQQQQELFASQQPSRGMMENDSGNSNRLLTRIDGEEEEMEVIGSGVSGSFGHRTEIRPRLPMRMPNLKYDYPESSAQNFSPGTSLIFNAFRGNSSLLTQTYMATGGEEDDAIQERLQQRVLEDQPLDRQQQQRQRALPSAHPDDDHNYPPYYQQQNADPSYRLSHERPSRPYVATDHNRGSGQTLDLRDQRSTRNPGNTQGHDDRVRDLVEEAGTRACDPSPTRIGETHDSRSIAHSSRAYNDYPPRTQPLTQTSSADTARSLPQHSTASASHPHSQNDYEHDSRHIYSTSPSHRYHPFQASQLRDPSPGDWDKALSKQRPYPTAAIDIPQPHHRRSANGPREHDLQGPMETQHNRYTHSLYHTPSTPTGSSGFRPLTTQRPAGPHYALTRVNYQMIYDYAKEIRECLLKGKVGTTDQLLYNAEILSKVFMGCRVDRDPKEQEEEGAQAVNPHQIRCTSCNIVKTPEWRKGPLVWGKISRIKAAAAKSKIEDAAKSEAASASDAQMANATPTNHGGDMLEISPASEILVSSNMSRKGGCDQSAAMDADDAEMHTKNEDLASAIGQQQQYARSAHVEENNDVSLKQQQQQQQTTTPVSASMSISSQQQALTTDGVFPCKDAGLYQHQLDNERSTIVEGNGTYDGSQSDPRHAFAQLPAVPDTPSRTSGSSAFESDANSEREPSAVGRKLALSYLLA
ncbi:hypothetical protein BGX28_003170 [Mortierella sp. GBA30]|nr:hypothetical protein BGX28_003170 [Mortierella sp. GBA30]